MAKIGAGQVENITQYAREEIVDMIIPMASGVIPVTTEGEARPNISCAVSGGAERDYVQWYPLRARWPATAQDPNGSFRYVRAVFNASCAAGDVNGEYGTGNGGPHDYYARTQYEFFDEDSDVVPVYSPNGPQIKAAYNTPNLITFSFDGRDNIFNLNSGTYGHEGADAQAAVPVDQIEIPLNEVSIKDPANTAALRKQYRITGRIIPELETGQSRQSNSPFYNLFYELSNDKTYIKWEMLIGAGLVTEDSNTNDNWRPDLDPNGQVGNDIYLPGYTDKRTLTNTQNNGTRLTNGLGTQFQRTDDPVTFVLSGPPTSIVAPEDRLAGLSAGTDGTITTTSALVIEASSVIAANPGRLSRDQHIWPYGQTVAYEGYFLLTEEWFGAGHVYSTIQETTMSAIATGSELQVKGYGWGDADKSFGVSKSVPPDMEGYNGWNNVLRNAVTAAHDSLSELYSEGDCFSFTDENFAPMPNRIPGGGPDHGHINEAVIPYAVYDKLGDMRWMKRETWGTLSRTLMLGDRQGKVFFANEKEPRAGNEIPYSLDRLGNRNNKLAGDDWSFYAGWSGGTYIRENVDIDTKWTDRPRQRIGFNAGLPTGQTGIGYGKGPIATSQEDVSNGKWLSHSLYTTWSLPAHIAMLSGGRISRLLNDVIIDRVTTFCIHQFTEFHAYALNHPKQENGTGSVHSRGACLPSMGTPRETGRSIFALAQAMHGTEDEYLHDTVVPRNFILWMNNIIKDDVIGCAPYREWYGSHINIRNQIFNPGIPQVNNARVWLDDHAAAGHPVYLTTGSEDQTDYEATFVDSRSAPFAETSTILGATHWSWQTMFTHVYYRIFGDASMRSLYSCADIQTRHPEFDSTFEEYDTFTEGLVIYASKMLAILAPTYFPLKNDCESVRNFITAGGEDFELQTFQYKSSLHSAMYGPFGFHRNSHVRTVADIPTGHERLVGVSAPNYYYTGAPGQSSGVWFTGYSNGCNQQTGPMVAHLGVDGGGVKNWMAPVLLHAFDIAYASGDTEETQRVLDILKYCWWDDPIENITWPFNNVSPAKTDSSYRNGMYNGGNGQTPYIFRNTAGVSYGEYGWPVAMTVKEPFRERFVAGNEFEHEINGTVIGSAYSDVSSNFGFQLNSSVFGGTHLNVESSGFGIEEVFSGEPIVGFATVAPVTVTVAPSSIVVPIIHTVTNAVSLGSAHSEAETQTPLYLTPDPVLGEAHLDVSTNLVSVATAITVGRGSMKTFWYDRDDPAVYVLSRVGASSIGSAYIDLVSNNSVPITDATVYGRHYSDVDSLINVADSSSQVFGSTHINVLDPIEIANVSSVTLGQNYQLIIGGKIYTPNTVASVFGSAHIDIGTVITDQDPAVIPEASPPALGEATVIASASPSPTIRVTPTAHYKNSSHLAREIARMSDRQSRLSKIYRHTLKEMVSMFNGISVMTEENQVIEVLSMPGTQERSVAELHAKETNIILPLISVTKGSTAMDLDRRRPDTLLNHETAWDDDKGRAVRVVSLASAPVNISYRVNVWAKWIHDIDQISEQILRLFNPSQTISTPWGNSIEAYLIDEEDASDIYNLGDGKDRTFRKTFNISLETYIPSPRFTVTNTGAIERFNYEVVVPETQ